MASIDCRPMSSLLLLLSNRATVPTLLACLPSCLPTCLPTYRWVMTDIEATHDAPASAVPLHEDLANTSAAADQALRRSGSSLSLSRGQSWASLVGSRSGHGGCGSSGGGGLGDSFHHSSAIDRLLTDGIDDGIGGGGDGCLLYTSPSPRDRQKSRMPSSA